MRHPATEDEEYQESYDDDGQQIVEQTVVGAKDVLFGIHHTHTPFQFLHHTSGNGLPLEGLIHHVPFLMVKDEGLEPALARNHRLGSLTYGRVCTVFDLGEDGLTIQLVVVGMDDIRAVVAKQCDIAVGRGLRVVHNLRKMNQRHVDAQHTHTRPVLAIDRQTECHEGEFPVLLVLQGFQPTDATCSHRFRIPRLFGVGCHTKLMGGHKLSIIFVHVDHHRLAGLEIIGFEGSGATCYVGVARHHTRTEFLHRLRFVAMTHQVIIHVAGRLLHTQQDIVDMARRGFQCM